MFNIVAADAVRRDAVDCVDGLENFFEDVVVVGLGRAELRVSD